jgi:hypothetical protein
VATIINTANTISVAITPGEDKLRPNTSVRSIFTFGDYRVEEPVTNPIIDLNAYKYATSKVSTLDSLGYSAYNINRILQVQSNEINFDPAQPTSYAYFSSFYTKIATAINTITATFPYAILSEKFNIGNNVTDIYYDNFFNTTTLKIDETSLINQGQVLYKSGDTSNVNIYYDYSKYAIQISGQSSIYSISEYNYDSLNQKLYFKIPGQIFTGNSTTENLNIYIRPSEQRLAQFENTISQLEYQLLYVGKFYIPGSDQNQIILSSYTWPKTIDGFNPDSYGSYFDTFEKKIFGSESVGKDKNNKKNLYAIKLSLSFE